MFVYAGFTAVAEKLDEIIERLTPPRQPRAHSRRNWSLAARILHPHAPTMFVVTEAEATAIRTAFEQRDELSAVGALRRLFPGICRCRSGTGVDADRAQTTTAASSLS